MPVYATCTVGLETFIDLTVQAVYLCSPPRAGHSRSGIGNDVPGIDQSFFEERGQSEDDAGRVTTGISDKFGAPDHCAPDLRQPVDRFLEIRGVEMRFIPGAIDRWIAQAVIG